MVDRDGNLRGADIRITWDDNETFLHGIRVVRPDSSIQPGMRPAMSTPHQPIGGRDRDDFPSTVRQQTRPVMSTPYRPTGGQDRDLGTPSTRPLTSEMITVTPEVDIQMRRPPTDTRQGYRPAAPIQRFNNKSLNWPAWFRHFRVVADVHGWGKDQRALQLVSYLDETAMNVAQELGDADLYNYDVLVKLLSDRFDPASRVSACRSRFHGRSRRHHEDADAFADALAELCRVGYPQSPAELRQELIAEQFVRGQSDTRVDTAVEVEDQPFDAESVGDSDLKICPSPDRPAWTPEASKARSLCASTVAFRPGSHVSDSDSSPSVDVSSWNDANTPSSTSDITLRLDQPIDLTGHILSPFYAREFNYQDCRFNSVAHLMCYRYAVLHGLKLFATAVRKWARPLTDFPTSRFQTVGWNSQCRSVLLEIYSHLCLTDSTVKTALLESGPRPFALSCLPPWGGIV